MWRQPTEADILRKISGDELDAIRDAALATGQPDPVADSLATAVNVVRGYIRANGRNSMGAAGTLPEALIEPAIDWMTVPLFARVAGMQIDPESTRATARRQAISLFQDVAAGKFAVEAPADIVDDGMGHVGNPAVNTPETNFSRPQQEGI